MKSSTEALVKALEILAQEIQSDGVANAAIAEAAGRLAELEQRNAELVAQVEVLLRELSEINTLLTSGSGRFDCMPTQRALHKVAELERFTPAQHLRQIQADAGRAGFIAGLEYPDKVYFQDATSDLSVAADQYADKIRQGG